MGTDHIVTSYDNDLNFLNDQICHMGKLTEQQLEKSIRAVLDNDPDLAKTVVKGDQEINDLEHRIDNQAVRMIALRQPVAGDLRAVISALKISSHLERMADYARNIAKAASSLAKSQYKIANPAEILKMSQLVGQMTHDVVQAYVSRDLETALEVWYRDEKVDELYIHFLKDTLKTMSNEPQNANALTQLLFVARNLERTGDHTKGIAEIIHFLITGEAFKEIHGET